MIQKNVEFYKVAQYLLLSFKENIKGQKDFLIWGEPKSLQTHFVIQVLRWSISKQI